MQTPELNFHADDGTFRLYPSGPMADEGARVFRVDPGDFVSCDFFNARSAQFGWKPFEDDIVFRWFVVHLVHQMNVVDLDESDLAMRIVASLAAMTAADNIGLESIVEALQAMQRMVVR